MKGQPTTPYASHLRCIKTCNENISTITDYSITRELMAHVANIQNTPMELVAGLSDDLAAVDDGGKENKAHFAAVGLEREYRPSRSHQWHEVLTACLYIALCDEIEVPASRPEFDRNVSNHDWRALADYLKGEGAKQNRDFRGSRQAPDWPSLGGDDHVSRGDFGGQG